LETSKENSLSTSVKGIGIKAMQMLGIKREEKKSLYRPNLTSVPAWSAFLLCNLPSEHRQNVKVQPVCSGLRKLLTDPDWHVRSQAAKAISLLHDY